MLNLGVWSLLWIALLWIGLDAGGACNDEIECYNDGEAEDNDEDTYTNL